MNETTLSNWTGCPSPAPTRLEGSRVVLTAFNSDQDTHALWDAFGQTGFNDLARYFPIHDFADAAVFGEWLISHQGPWHTMVFRERGDGAPLGMASYMRIDTANGSCETGSVMHAPHAQRSAAVTEAHFLMARHVFDDLGYRRYEWKLDNRNAASHAAAKRLGFTFEGVFRNHLVSRGRNRDTAWYAMIDDDWPVIRKSFELWLDSDNFDEAGQQKMSLAEVRGRLLQNR
ncbi:GNAT family N-acetyltransferase [Notoacmeibacter sp. MSK16QG-6]|uniref:GNAT family N-acetyltransferase n=1 Tax=Notoacmeibacter sp. MSK16QG-6 TaxID=2957982 RepID=UPI0020A15A9E|nr:GNAT family protein [Notoacmeibacter sp. MSK16QG-6]MCP1200385.1 GNAT family N-acetyltransferase [Notoacmeibacter sp. MSK16QG-6]